jgi:hypothetical protein
LVNDENATLEDIINKKVEIIDVANEQLELIKQQQELDVAEVERLRQ